MKAHDQAVLESLAPLKAAGFALHWLHPRTKKPIGSGWSEAPVASLDELRQTHAPGNNLGVRTGEPSAMAAGGHLHIFDLDIRIVELADEAWARFHEITGLRREDMPEVASGAGGESRHLLFVTDKPFRSKSLANSGTKHRATDGRWRFDWEIDLYGTDKHVVLPPSIHPDTGLEYRWIRPFDFDTLALGLGPFVPSAQIERLAVVENTTYEFEAREPLTFEPGQLERDLDSLPIERLDDYHDWITLGQALHHQFGAGEDGFDLWVEHSKRSQKFDASPPGVRNMRSKWRGFGRNRKQPVTMGTIRQWTLDAQRARLIASFDEEDEDPFDGDDAPAPAAFDGSDPATANDVDPIDAVGTVDAPAAPADWMGLLDFNEEGAIRATLHNVELIVRHDPRLIGLPQINEFTQETVQRRPPGHKQARRRNAAKETRQLGGRVWQVKDELNGDLWSDDRDFAIRSILEAPKTQGGYGVKVTDRDLKAAIVLSANSNPFHPIREYLERVESEWDGVPRIERLFIDHVGAPDDAYHRSVGRLIMVGAVTRIFEPGHKFDFVPILEGLQGKGKSSFIQALGKHWFAELDGDFHDPKQMVELMQGAWVMEIPELTGMNRADVRAIKAFVSRQTDRARLAYARRAGSFPRQVIFIGSTNDREYLKDDTGGRRFWPVVCTIREINITALETILDQLWAEAVTGYRQMRQRQPLGRLPLYLMAAEARTTALSLQESRRVETAEDAMAGRLAGWLDLPIRTGAFDEDNDEDGTPRYRNRTCLMQLWCEGLSGDPRSYNNAVAQQIGRAMNKVPGWYQNGTVITFEQPYGRQRAFYRDSYDPMTKFEV